jgi:hydrogenase expression/formation protein HypD
VTPNAEIDRALALARLNEIILVTFGDMMKVPGSEGNLSEARAEGADIRVVYSAMEALRIAGENPWKTVVFFGVGFETTAPTTAATILETRRQGLGNLFFYSVHKLIPPAMQALLKAGELRIDGFICPGHVSTIIGSRAFEFIPARYHIPCVTAGFEPLDILQAIGMLLDMHSNRTMGVANQYSRAVRQRGNATALEMMASVFRVEDVDWRGLGSIQRSGLKIHGDLSEFDAEKRLRFSVPPAREHAMCRCGEVLRGVCDPPECRLFGIACTPEHPIGPCMVSSEGSCGAWFLYGHEELSTSRHREREV